MASESPAHFDPRDPLQPLDPYADPYVDPYAETYADPYAETCEDARCASAAYGGKAGGSGSASGRGGEGYPAGCFCGACGGVDLAGARAIDPTDLLRHA